MHCLSVYVYFFCQQVQINYNYAAKRHVDGNNQGPSYIRSFGQHSGGDLWTADQGVISCRGRDMRVCVCGGGRGRVDGCVRICG